MPEAAKHFVNRTGWLRTAVLGANDGVISTASLIAGVAAASASRTEILTAAFAGWAAGAMAMAAGEYVSVSSQADSERADLEREQKSLAEAPEYEFHELVEIYERRGLSSELAQEVASQLTRKNALAAHARDELGLSEHGMANPLQAAVASGIAFSVGAFAPTIAAWLAPPGTQGIAASAVALVFLFVLGAVGGWLGGASTWRPALRVGFWGALAMGVTAGIGALAGHAL